MNDIREHKEARVDTVLRYLDDNGDLTQPQTVARIVYVPCAYRRQTYTVEVYDWGEQGDSYPPNIQRGSARGYGYDKRTAALCGLTVAGVEMGDHCDPKGRPTLDAWLRDNQDRYMLVRGSW